MLCQEPELELWTWSQGNMDSQCCIWDLYMRGKIVLAKRPPADLPAKCQLDIWKTLKHQWQGCTWEIQNNLGGKKKPALKDSLTFWGKPQKVSGLKHSNLNQSQKRKLHADANLFPFGFSGRRNKNERRICPRVLFLVEYLLMAQTCF